MQSCCCCCCGDPNRNYQPGQKIKDSSSQQQTAFIIDKVHGEKNDEKFVLFDKLANLKEN